MINPSSSDPHQPLRPPGRTRLDVTDLDLARNLGVTVGCLRELGSQGRASLRPVGAPAR